MKPEEMKRWVWIPHDGEGVLIRAKDFDDAHAQAISNRMKTGQTEEEANGWFYREDVLTEITSELPEEVVPADFKTHIEHATVFSMIHAGDNGGEWLTYLNGEEVSLNTPYTSDRCDTNKFDLVVEHFDDATDENWNEIFEVEVHITLTRKQERKNSDA